MDCIAINERAPVGSGVDLVLRHVGEGDARDLLMPLREIVLIVLHEEMERFDERVGLSGTGAGFDEKALFALQAAIYFGECSLTCFFRRVQLFRDLSHLEQPLLRGRRRQPLGRPPRLRQERRQPPTISVRRGCSRVRSSQFRRLRT